MSVRIGIAALAFVGAAVLSATAWAADSPMAGDQWKPTDETMADLLADGYELVTVVAPSNQSRLYFLRKPGKIAKCKEWAISSAPPPPPMPIAAARRSASVADIPPPDKPVPEMRIDVECAELVQPAPEQKR